MSRSHSPFRSQFSSVASRLTCILPGLFLCCLVALAAIGLEWIERRWTGRAWNWPSSQPTLAWGYPQGAPFAGNRLITTTSTEWYQLNRNASESQLSKYIGSESSRFSQGP